MKSHWCQTLTYNYPTSNTEFILPADCAETLNYKCYNHQYYLKNLIVMISALLRNLSLWVSFSSHFEEEMPYSTKLSQINKTSKLLNFYVTLSATNFDDDGMIGGCTLCLLSCV